MNNSNLGNEFSENVADSGSKQNGRWTKEEHLKFLEGVKHYGKNWKKIQQVVKTRNGAQIRSHAQKFFNKLYTANDLGISENDKIQQGNIIQNCIINSNGHYSPPQSNFLFQEIQNFVFPSLDPFTLLPVSKLDGQVSQKPLFPHQIWQQSNQFLKGGFLQTYVEIQNPVVSDHKQNTQPKMIRKSSFTRCE